MASTISSATLTVTVTESISLNGSTMGASNVLTVGSINEINQRIVTLDAGNVRALFEFGTVVAPGKFISANVKYLRITNKDDTNGVSLNLESASSNCWIVVLAGQSFMLSASTAGIEADDDTTIAAPTLQDVVKISAHSANVIDLDCYMALT
jgi:hypothetical protein|tara:strand:- start:36 stop:491 length:456 start_codon:yes stop_codon:yes gene_type:complete